VTGCRPEFQHIHRSYFLDGVVQYFYRVSRKSFPDYKYLLQKNYMEYKHIFFFKCNSTQEVF